MKFILLIIISLFNFSQLFAQEEWMNFTYGEFVTALADDGDYLWIGTNGGLVQFDKQTEKMTYYNMANVLPSNLIYSIAIDSSHNLWVGTGRGLTRFDGNNWYTFNKENSDLPSNSITAIAVDSANTLYMGSDKWFTTYDGQNWKSIATGNPYAPYINIADIKFDSKGKVWIGASWGVGLLNEDSITIIGSDIMAHRISSIAIDSADNIWAGDLSIGLFKYDGIWTHYDTSNSGIPSNYIYDLKIDKEGNLWGAAYASLFKYKDENWEIYNSDNSILPDETYHSLEFDTDNTLWLGTGSGHQGEGLYKYNGMDWKHYSTGSSGLLMNLPYSIITDDRGYLWVGYLGRETIQQYNGSSWPTFTVEDADVFNSQFTLVCNEDSTKIWQGHGLILLFIGKNWAGIYSDKKKMISDYVKSDANDNIWIITSAERIKKYDGQQWTIYTQENTGISYTDVDKISFSPSGTAYISSDLGFLKFDGTNWELLPVNLFTSQPDGFIFNTTFLFDSTGIMWLGIPGEGLIKYDGNQKTIYDESNSDLPDNTIQDLDFDHAGNLWIATPDFGLVKYDKNNTWEIYNRNTSGKSSDFLIREIDIDINDNVWFISEWDGLCVFREGGIIYPSSITYDQSNSPTDFKLFQNYPNPFNPETTISFSIPQSGHVSVKIYDLTGRLVRALTNGYNTAGLHSIVWHGRNENGIDAATGMYIYQVKYQGRVLNKKLLLIR